MTDDLSDRRTLPSNVSPEKVRKQAIELFEKGYGYKATASLLKLPVGRVRDWLRCYRKGHFKAEVPTRLFRYDASVRTTALQLAEQGLSILRSLPKQAFRSARFRK